ncbi:FAA hydrolase [Xylaria intraflava]|nr:FAA hydrolase [Xylaria intraflava]
MWAGVSIQFFHFFHSPSPHSPFTDGSTTQPLYSLFFWGFSFLVSRFSFAFICHANYCPLRSRPNMKFQRVDGRVARVRDDNASGDAQSPTTLSVLYRVLEENPPDKMDAEKRALPFQPRSYRDFMLFERHYYGAAIGMTSLYRPLANTLGRLFSAVTGADFPLFKPPTLWYKQPIFYQSNHLAFYSDGASITYPAYCEYLDVELELGVVLGKPLYNATPDEAIAAIAGFCVLNDFSARNVQMEEMASGFGPQHSKSFANSISSTVVSADEILPRLGSLSGRVLINGLVVKEPRIDDNWQFSLGQALSHVSKGTRLYPGEFFGSGTFPLGAGIEYTAFKLQVGDVVKLEIDGIGSVTNTIVAEAP